MIARILSKNMSMHRFGLFSIAVPVLFIFAQPAAADWQVLPSIGVGVEYDDNANLSPVPELESSISGYGFDADITFLHRSELTEFQLVPRIRLKRYPDDSTFDSNDAFLKALFDHRGQRSRFRVRGSFQKEPTRIGERSEVDFDIEEPGEIPTDDSGQIDESADSVDRQRVRLRPEWSYRIGQRASVEIGATLLDNSFHDDDLGLFTDFTTSEVNSAIGFDWTERDTFSIGGYYRDNNFDIDTRDASSRGVELGYRRAVSEQTEFRIDVGVDSTERENSDSGSNTVGSVSVVHKLETGRILATYRRVVAGSGAGFVSVRDLINVSGSRDLSERLSVGLGLRGYQSNSLDGDTGNTNERDYLQARALLTWRFTRVFSVDFDYRYSFLDRQNLESDAASNRFNLWFRYNPIRR